MLRKVDGLRNETGFKDIYSWANFGESGSQLEVRPRGDFQTFDTWVESKLDNNNHKSCSQLITISSLTWVSKNTRQYLNGFWFLHKPLGINIYVCLMESGKHKLLIVKANYGWVNSNTWILAYWSCSGILSKISMGLIVLLVKSDDLIESIEMYILNQTN